MTVEKLYNYEEAVTYCGSAYALRQRLADGTFFRLEKGVFSESAACRELVRLKFRHPNACFTGMSAFYFHALSDVIPEKHTLASLRSATRIKDARVSQVFMSESIFSIGQMDLEYDGVSVRVYDRERMLIELLRAKTKWPYDYYKDVIAAYRRQIHQLDVAKVYDYLESFSQKEICIERLESEVL